MTSPAKIAANRRNARRSTGPRSAAGKARARRNAFRHGLTTPASLDHVAMDRIDNLVDALTIDVHSQLQFQLATVAAEAQAEIERVRQTKVNLVNRASAQLREEGAGLLSAGERAALAFAGKTEILMACERYERRAISRRNRALRALAKLECKLQREEAIELVGPPRPTSSLTRQNPFRENVLRLEVEQVMGSWRLGCVAFSRTYEWQPGKSLYGWQPGKSMVGVHVTTYGDHGFLDLRFQVNGEPIAQTFALAGTAMRVGGVRWTVKCPESGKMVRDLYLHDRHFRSRHALGLSYYSNSPKKRHWERAQKLMDRLGARWGEPPIRPKYMQRRTFERLADELFDACLRDASAILGPARALRGLPGGDVVWKHAWDIGLGDLFAFRGLSPDDVVWNGKTYEYRPPPKGPRGRNSSNQ
jgi:hypothetical protein